MKPHNRFLKTAEIACLSLTLIAILAAWLSPARGFEESIYASTPDVVWSSIIASNLIALIVVTHQLLKHRLRGNPHWLIGFSILMMNRLLVHYIPTIRGYYTYEGDHMTNIGHAIDIVLAGHITPDNFYPVVHLLIGTVVIVNNGGVVAVGNISTPLMSCFFVVCLFLLARRLSQNPYLPPIAAAIAVPVMFNRYDIFLMPYGWAIFFTPFALYLLFGPLNHLRDKVVALVTLSVFPFLHPLSCLYLAITLAVVGSMVVLRDYFRGVPNLPPMQGRVFIGYALVIVAIVIPWTLSFQQFEPNLRQLYAAFTTGTSPNVIGDMASTLEKIDLGSLGFIIILVKTMGDDIIFLVPSVIACFYIIVRRSRRNNVKLLSFALIFLLTGSLYALYLFNLVPGLAFVASQRLLFFVSVFTPILFAIWMLSNCGSQIIRPRMKTTVSVAFVVFASTISILSLFPSPFVVYNNNQVTLMDVDGYDWLYQTRDESVPITSILSSPHRYADLFFGTWLGHVMVRKSDPPPDHFGFGDNETPMNWPHTTTYLVLLEVSRTTYSGVWSTVGRFTDADFERIATNSNYVKVFSNGECEIWEVSFF